jgi:hypothetical protein
LPGTLSSSSKRSGSIVTTKDYRDTLIPLAETFPLADLEYVKGKIRR